MASRVKALRVSGVAGKGAIAAMPAPGEQLLQHIPQSSVFQSLASITSLFLRLRFSWLN